MAVGPIPWTSIDRFIQSRLERGWIDPEEAPELEALIIAMDDDEATHRAKAGKTPNPKGEPSDDDSTA